MPITHKMENNWQFKEVEKKKEKKNKEVKYKAVK